MKKSVKNPKKEWKPISFNAIFALLVVLIPSLFYTKIWLTTLLLSILIIFALIKWKSKLTIAVFIFGAIFGPFAEMIAISFGAWKYTLPNFYSVPTWLFLVWGAAAVFIFEMAKELKKEGIKDNLK